jgi:hypothetical protein
MLCSGCYAAGATPGAHLPEHLMEADTEAVTIADDVARLLSEMGFPLPEFDPSVKTRWLPKRCEELRGRTARSLVVATAPTITAAAAPTAPVPDEASAAPAGVAPLQQSDLLSTQTFEHWVLRSERLLPLVGGHCSHFLPRCAFVEEYTRDEHVGGVAVAVAEAGGDA